LAVFRIWIFCCFFFSWLDAAIIKKQGDAVGHSVHQQGQQDGSGGGVGKKLQWM